jgi:sulfite reductase alpha subunit-like flavoprotein
MIQYIRYLFSSWYKKKRKRSLEIKLQRRQKTNSLLIDQIENRLKQILYLLPKKPKVFQIIAKEQLDPLDTQHGTFRLRFRSLFPISQEIRVTDVFYVLLENEPSRVDQLLSLLQFDPRDQVRIEPYTSLYYPQQIISTDVKTALTKHVEIEIASPQLLAWAGLEEAADHNQITEKNHEDYHRKLEQTLDWSLPHPEYKPRLFDLPSVIKYGLAQNKKPLTLKQFLDFQDRVFGRSYTLSDFSKNLDGTLELEITVSKVFRQMETPDEKTMLLPSRGSTYLINKEISNIVSGWILPDVYTFRPEWSMNQPVIIICTGSGISALLALLRTSKPKYPIWLFYGIQSWPSKALYELELLQYIEDKRITRLFLACSRPKNKEEPKQYVQHLLWNHRTEIGPLVREGSPIFLCGSRKMGNDVRQTLIEILVDQGLVETLDQGEDLMSKWEETLQYQPSVSGIA